MDARLDPAWFDSVAIPIPFDYHHESGGHIGYSYTVGDTATEQLFALDSSGTILYQEAATYSVVSRIPRSALHLQEAFKSFVVNRPAITRRSSQLDASATGTPVRQLGDVDTHGTSTVRPMYAYAALATTVVLTLVYLARKRRRF